MLTPVQQKAVASDGNVLVMAGAGTGKTRTLVERCVERVLRGVCSVDAILMVTFTEAAAAEMRQRIRSRLEEEFARAPENLRLAEQLALLDAAHISTLHSFCLRLVREHFYELEIDPQVAALDEGEANALADETLKTLLDECYAGTDSFAVAVQGLIQKQGRGFDDDIAKLVLKLFHFAQTQPSPDAWMLAQIESFGHSEPAQWRRWLGEALLEWREDWLPVLRAASAENVNAHQCAAALGRITAPMTRSETTAVLNEILVCASAWPKSKQEVLGKSIEKLFDEAEFLNSLAAPSTAALQGGEVFAEEFQNDPLTEDWNWVREPMSALLRLTQQFTHRFAAAKRELGALDFHDQEQFALRLLRDGVTGRPTRLAEQWRARLRFVFVDEYQDINAAQDAILTALAREGAGANRFLVGDVKQSIYRFRLANPRIFQNYAREWSKPASGAAVIPLTENFRSREGILSFVNSLFTPMMRAALGGVDYDEAARLQFGNTSGRNSLGVAAGAGPPVELHLLCGGAGEENSVEEGGDSTAAEIGAVELQARWVAERLRQLRAEPQLVWDVAAQKYRPVEWRDMVVLLRSPAKKTEMFAKEFARAGVPLQVARAGFYESMEINDLVNLLTLLDNPLQDVPVLAVLRSPLAGFSLDELALIRWWGKKVPFWQALLKFHQAARSEDFAARLRADAKEAEQAALQSLAQALWPKVDVFLQRFARWRQAARQNSLSHCLETVLQETHYETWLLTQPRGKQRQANVGRLLALTRRFDQFHRHGLLRFLRYLEAQRAAEIDQEPAPTESENSIHLMSIHQSKGLEFPVVVLADIGNGFNFEALKAGVILDEQFGLCPKVIPPATQERYPSLPAWLASRRQRRETLGEEIRLLYVALTRACDKLILTGDTSRKEIEKYRARNGADEISLPEVLSANCFLDWLALWLARDASFASDANAGQNETLRWEILEGNNTSSPVARAPEDEPVSSPANLPAASNTLEELRARLLWRYPFQAATSEPAKTSVSILRRRFSDETADEAAVARFARDGRTARRERARDQLSAAEVGTAHHRFQQFVELNQSEDADFFEREAERMERLGLLSASEKAALDLRAAGDFWRSEIGRQIRAQAPQAQRELEFTARMTAQDLRGFAHFPNEAELEGEFVVVQGAVDLAVILPEEIWLLDFKTDQVTSDTVGKKIELYRPQLSLYAAALAQIYHRPVRRKWLHFLSLEKSVALD